MADDINFQFPQLFPEVMDLNVFIATITAIDYDNDIANIVITGIGSFSNVEIFYHGSNSGGVTGGSNAFNIGDEVYVINPKGSCTPSVTDPFSKMRIIGFASGERIPACIYNEDFASDSKWSVVARRLGTETFVVAGGVGTLNVVDGPPSSISIEYTHVVDAVDCTIDIDIIEFGMFTPTEGPIFIFYLLTDAIDYETPFASINIKYRLGSYYLGAYIYEDIGNYKYLANVVLIGMPEKFKICRKLNLISLYYYYGEEWVEVPNCIDFEFSTKESAQLMSKIQIHAGSVVSLSSNWGYVSFDNLTFIKGCPTS